MSSQPVGRKLLSDLSPKVELPQFGRQVWPPPDSMVDDEGYPMSVADYLDDSELLSNFNRLQLRIRDHLTALRTGLNVPLPPTAENRRACAQGRLSAQTRLQAAAEQRPQPMAPLPLYPLIGPATGTCFDQINGILPGSHAAVPLTCPTRPVQSESHANCPQEASVRSPAHPTQKGSKKKKQKSPANDQSSSRPENLASNRIHALGAQLAREICAKSSSEKDDSSSVSASTSVPVETAVPATTKTSSSTSSGCESTADALGSCCETGSVEAALTADLLPWYQDQLQALAHSLSRSPVLFNGRVLRSQAQVTALLRAYFQAGLVMGRLHALKIFSSTPESESPAEKSAECVPSESNQERPAPVPSKPTLGTTKGKKKQKGGKK